MENFSGTVKMTLMPWLSAATAIPKCCDCYSYSGVACSGIYYRAAFFKDPAPLGIVDHVDAYAVLYASCGVHKFKFCVDIYSGLNAHMVDLKYRRVADHASDIFKYVIHGDCLLLLFGILDSLLKICDKVINIFDAYRESDELIYDADLASDICGDRSVCHRSGVAYE